MSDLVDRDSVIMAIKETEINFNIISDIDFSKYKKEIQEIVDNIVLAQIKAIESLENQKTGHWIFKNDNILIPTGYYQCSECEEGKLLNKDNFCPNCGAKMKGENK